MAATKVDLNSQVTATTGDVRVGSGTNVVARLTGLAGTVAIIATTLAFAGNGTISAVSALNLSGATASLQSTTGDASVQSAADLTVSAVGTTSVSGNLVSITALTDIVVNSSGTLTMTDGLSNGFYIDGAGSVYVGAFGGIMNLQATGNALLQSTTGSVTVDGASINATSTTTTRINGDTYVHIDSGTGGLVQQNVGSSLIQLTDSGYSVSIPGTGSHTYDGTVTTTTTGSADYTVHAGGTVTISANAAASSISYYNDITVSAANAVWITANGATAAVTLTGASIVAQAINGDWSATATNGGMFLDAASNVEMSSAFGSVTLNANSGQQFQFNPGGTGHINSVQFSVNGTSGVLVGSSSAQVEVSGNSGVNIHADSGSITCTSSGDQNLTAATTVAVTATTGNFNVGVGDNCFFTVANTFEVDAGSIAHVSTGTVSVSAALYTVDSSGAITITATNLTGPSYDISLITADSGGSAGSIFLTAGSGPTSGNIIATSGGYTTFTSTGLFEVNPSAFYVNSGGEVQLNGNNAYFYVNSAVTLYADDAFTATAQSTVTITSLGDIVDVSTDGAAMTLAAFEGDPSSIVTKAINDVSGNLLLHPGDAPLTPGSLIAGGGNGTGVGCAGGAFLGYGGDGYASAGNATIQGGNIFGGAGQGGNAKMKGGTAVNGGARSGDVILEPGDTSQGAGANGRLIINNATTASTASNTIGGASLPALAHHYLVFYQSSTQYKIPVYAA